MAPQPDHGPALPEPDPEARAHSDRLAGTIRRRIVRDGGWIDFSAYMEMALYEPGLGYYAAGATKLGGAGDFVTAPELSPLFGRTLARPVGDVLRETGGAVLEFGAGTGKLAEAMLPELEAIGALPDRYLVLETSPQLAARQQARLAALPDRLAARVEWIAKPPDGFRGAIVANEVLDAMPVRVIEWRASGVAERGVRASAHGFEWEARDGIADPALAEAAAALDVPPGYVSEIGMAGRAWMRTVAGCLERGAALLVDYGFPQREYYHPDRRHGTLMCHYRHRAHDDPFFLPGMQDITAHVDFSAIAAAAAGAGLETLAYASQAEALIAWGLLERLGETDPRDAARYLPQVGAVQRLVSPAEMGELFKVLVVGRGVAGIPGLSRASAARL